MHRQTHLPLDKEVQRGWVGSESQMGEIQLQPCQALSRLNTSSSGMEKPFSLAPVQRGSAGLAAQAVLPTRFRRQEPGSSKCCLESQLWVLPRNLSSGSCSGTILCPRLQGMQQEPSCALPWGHPAGRAVHRQDLVPTNSQARGTAQLLQPTLLCTGLWSWSSPQRGRHCWATGDKSASA